MTCEYSSTEIVYTIGPKHDKHGYIGAFIISCCTLRNKKFSLESFCPLYGTLINLRVLKNGRTQKGTFKNLKGCYAAITELILVLLRTIRESI